MPDLTAIILAGGKSSRMGQDKALMEIQGQPLLNRTFACVAPLATHTIVVTPHSDRYRPLLPHTVQWVADPLDAQGETQGPLMGFAQGLAQVQTPWTIAVACDLPNLDRSAIARWHQALPQLTAPTLAYVPRYGDRWEPLCGFYRQSSLASLAPFLTSGGRSFQRWLATVTVEAIPAVDANLLFNLNTPTDWQQLHQT